jgi:hypothetical protein
MDLFESPQYIEYIEALSSGIAATEAATGTLHLVNKQTARVAEYMDVAKEIAALKGKHGAAALEYSYIMKEIVYGKRDAELKDRHQRVTATLKHLEQKVLAYEAYLSQMRKAAWAKREALETEVAGYFRQLKNGDASARERLAVLNKLHTVHEQLKALDEHIPVSIVTRLPRVEQGNEPADPPKVKVKLQKRPKPPKAHKRMQGGAVDVLSKVKALVKANFGGEKIEGSRSTAHTITSKNK